MPSSTNKVDSAAASIQETIRSNGFLSSVTNKAPLATSAPEPIAK
jgi:hypothetical protein